MRKVSKIVLNAASFFGFLSVLTGVIFSFVYWFVIAYFGSAFLSMLHGLSRYIGVWWLIGGEYGILISLTAMISLAISLLVILMGAIICLIGNRGKKGINVANIIFGFAGALPTLIIGGLTILLSLAMVGGGIAFLVYVLSNIYNLYFSSFLYMFLGVVEGEMLVGAFVLMGTISILTGCLFGLLSLVGGIFGLIAHKKEKKEEITQ